MSEGLNSEMTKSATACGLRKLGRSSAFCPNEAPSEFKRRRDLGSLCYANSRLFDEVVYVTRCQSGKPVVGVVVAEPAITQIHLAVRYEGVTPGAHSRLIDQCRKIELFRADQV